MTGLSAALAIGAMAGLIVPLCGAIIALLRVRDAYYVNTVRILGIMFISTAVCMAAVGMVGALARGEQPIWPYLVMTGLPALAVARIVQTQTKFLPQHPQKWIDGSH